jgi:hypothetical protein
MLLDRALNQLDACGAQPWMMQVGGVQIDPNARSTADCLAREAHSCRCDSTPRGS